jgi:hypothetical protein
MSNFLGPLLRRAAAGALALAAIAAPAAARAGAPPVPEAEHVPFAQRYGAVQRGGIVRAANTAVTCRPAPRSAAGAAVCPAARAGRPAVNGDFQMTYVDVDRDPNTYNSSRAEVRLPKGSSVSYARLYWGGNLRVGEQKPSEDNARVLVAEPGGRYQEVLADTVVGHRVAPEADAYQASADVTGLVRRSGPGLYTVAQLNVAMGRSAAGAWGGWTLVVAYANPKEPLRLLSLWDGFDVLGAGREILLPGLPPDATGQVGLVAYDGDRGRTGESLALFTGRAAPALLGDAANPRDDVLNSTISGASGKRVPAYAHTLGYDSDVFGLGDAARAGAHRIALRLTGGSDEAWAGVLFVAAGASR